MRDKPSGTSNLVAFLRGLSAVGVTQVRDFSDPYAAQLLPPWQGRALRGLGWLLERNPRWKQGLVRGARGSLDVVALRSRAIDLSWEEAYRGGVRQLVLLGAGLDARPYRLPDLQDVSLLEVDHPATQRFKRERARGLRSRAAAHTYVPLDLRKDDLGRALREVGLRTDERAHVVWEGVTHYLPHQVTAATLEALASLVPSGSRLAASYAEPEAGPESLVARARTWALRLAGEPHVGLLERTHMVSMLARAGWHVRTDEGIDDLASRLSDGPGDERRTILERVVVAERA